jgi:DNA polymerase III delta subunit
LSNNKAYLNYSNLEKDLVSGKLRSVYYIVAEDSYFLNKASALLRKKILGSEDRKENYFLKYADELSYEEFIDLCTNFSSLFSSQKIIIVRRCEKFGRKLNDVLEYSHSPEPDTTLLLVFGKEYVEEKKLYKTFEFYDFAELPENEYIKWVKTEFENRGCHVEDDVIGTFISLVPINFGQSAQEIDKIAGYLGDNKDKVVTKEIIYKLTGYDNEYTPYDLMSSVIKGERSKAVEILNYLINRGSINEVYLLSLISNYMMDIMAYHKVDMSAKNHNQIYRDYKLWGDRINFVRLHQKYGKNRNYEYAFERILYTDQSLKNSMLDSKVLLGSLIQDLMNI